MPSVPNEISIKFTAEDKGLEKVLNNITAAQQKHNKQVQKSSKVLKASQEQISLNMREYSLLSKKLADAGQKVEELGLKEKTLTKASEGNAKALAKVRKAVSLNIKELNRSVGMQESAALAAKKHIL